MIKKVLTILNLVLITGAVFFGVKIFYTVISASLSTQIPVLDHVGDHNALSRKRSFKPEKSSDSLSFEDYQVIVERDLFKTKKTISEKSELNAQDVENLEKTSLKLKLWGTITGDSGMRYAVIEDTNTHKQKLYREGSTVSGGQEAEIKRILRRKVVLNVNGKDEVLEMEDNGKPGGEGRKTANYSDFSGQSYLPGGENVVTIDREKINESLENINNLMRQVRVRPYFENGKPGGILLSGIQRNSIFEKMGLASGDIVRAINGSPIRSVDDAIKFYRDLKSASNVSLQIKRRGREKTITYRIR